jgi:hypothetical protein
VVNDLVDGAEPVMEMGLDPVHHPTWPVGIQPVRRGPSPAPRRDIQEYSSKYLASGHRDEQQTRLSLYLPSNLPTQSIQVFI